MVTFRVYFDKLSGWIDTIMAFPRVEEPKPSFNKAVSEIVDFNKYIKQQACPNCHKKDSFVATDYERGKRGFEARILCTGCRTTGIINNSGFQYKVVRVPGEAKK